MGDLRVAIVGLGKMGLVHASILNTMPNVNIVGICDKSYLLLKLIKKLFRTARAVDDVKKLAELDINSVYVTTPIPGHYPVIKTLLSKRIVENIFVEKTLASDLTKSEELCGLMQDIDGVNMVGYMKRFAVTFAEAKRKLDEGVLGKIVSFDSYAYSSDFSRAKSGSLKSDSRGGVLSDLGSHVIDLALWFFGDFSVDTASLKSIIGGNWEDSVDFTVTKPGLTGNFHVCWCIDEYRLPSFGLRIEGDGGTMEVSDYFVKLDLINHESRIWYKHDLNDHVAFLLGESEYCREDELFVNSVLTGVKAEPNFRTGSRVDKIIDQVKKLGK